MKSSRLLAIVLIAACSVSTYAAAEALKKNAMSPEKAGRFFASICFDIYPDVAKAQAKVQRKGFKYDAASGLFINAKKDQQMRINGKRCAFRFLTDVDLPDRLQRFGNAATDSSKTFPEGLDIDFGSEDAGNGLWRVAAKLDLK